MAYRLKPGKLTGNAVRKIAREQTVRAITSLSKDEVSPTDVHEGRKVVKRLRALLRLIEPALTPAEFAKRYKSIGRAGDLLAGARDRHVLEQTMDQLEVRFGAEAARAVAPLRQWLENSKSAEPSHIDAAALARARAAFTKEARRLSKLKIKGEGFDVVAKGLERTYKTGRANFARAYAQPSDERFHELRKAVQWHWRHMALLARAWPEHFAGRVAACQNLADQLGDDHDLCVLLAAATKCGGKDGEEATALKKLVSQRQDEVREEAYALCERLFAESPKAFRRRMQAYWSAKMPLAFPQAGNVAPDTA